ncbi:DUF3833 domain-containing protein [Curvivirga aplysinae]|uniref:DUF3833 domain-containing protein n=1 Tax=Curvivirga aplysinae TaxID=2529852 RepID=UPI0012BCAA94|nr:DUF3833 domain-containing protein [Curvivirga aplysinae]MTI08891.1 DUF3833 domain-containing protein [Curvivirga aplysinae]
MIRKLSLFLLSVLLVGCNSMKISDFENATPRFDLFSYFEGKSMAYGIFEDRFGNVKRQFRVEIQGTVTDGVLVLDEQFYFDDGERDERIWTIKKEENGHYTGTADDIIGTAKGIVAGNALNWRYDLDLKVGDSSLRVHFNDWMFLQEGDVLINRASVTKWGFEVGQVSIFFVRPADGV